jgi:hypothetical protein
MFAQPAAKVQIRAAGSSAKKLAHQRSTHMAHGLGHGAVVQAHMLQPTIGNQATLRPLAQRARSLTGNEYRDQHEQEAGRGEAPGTSWNFSKIPVFPPDRPKGRLPGFPLTAPSLLGVMQPKPAFGPIDDPLEHEADSIADQVMRTPDPKFSVTAASLQISRKCSACEEEEKAEILQIKPATTLQAPAAAHGLVHEVSRSPGQPLHPTIRTFFGSRFGHDFSQLRVHADENPSTFEALRAVTQTATAERMLQAQGSPSNTPGTATPTSATQAPVAPQDQIAQADSLRPAILRNAWVSVRQLQIACQEQADPTLLTQALPDQVRSFYAWLGIGPSDPDFCGEVALVLSDIDKNLNMTLPPPYFPTPQEMADPNELCNLGNQFAAANYEDTQVRICPKLLTSQFTDVGRALILTHELFHEPSFGMVHLTVEVMNTSHCGVSASEEAVANPYCVTNVIGDLGAGEVF